MSVSSFDYIGYTCPDVETKVYKQIKFHKSLSAILDAEDDNSQEQALRSVINYVISLAQDTGASRVRNAFDSALQEHERELDDLREDYEQKIKTFENSMRDAEDKIDELEATITILKDELQQSNDRIQEMEYTE